MDTSQQDFKIEDVDEFVESTAYPDLSSPMRSPTKTYDLDRLVG